MAAKRGIDVSEHNGTLDWAKIKANGVEFALIRSGYGKTAQDKQFAANVKGAAAQGIPYGIYHYSYALTEADARQEAALVLKLLEGLSPIYPVWIDMEDADGYKAKRMTLTKTAVTALCKAFVQEIRAAGYICGVYANKSWLESYIDVSQLEGCDIWLAQWAASPTWSGDYQVWQYTDSGSLSGLSGSFDMDLCYADYGAAQTLDVSEAVEKLAVAGVINTPAYWTAHAGDLKYLDALLIKLAATCHPEASAAVTTVEEAVARLAAQKVLDTPAYWLANYERVPYLSQLLMNAADHV